MPRTEKNLGMIAAEYVTIVSTLILDWAFGADVFETGKSPILV
jgi:hypothetical protein